MTIRAFIKQAGSLRLLNGDVCVRAGQGVAGALLLDYGVLHASDPSAYQEPDKSLVVECPWRLESRTEVIVGSGDARELIDSRIQACVGKRVRRSDVHPPSYMACINIDGDLALWIFPDDASDYVAQSDFPRSAYYVTGRAIVGGWEQ